MFPKGRVIAMVAAFVCLGLLAFYSIRQKPSNVPHAQPNSNAVVFGGAITPATEPLKNEAERAESKHEKRDERSAQDLQMMQQFKSAQSYRSFIQNALGDPTHGGHFYAYMAYMKCRQVAGVHFDAPPNSSPRVALAREELQKEIARCDGVFDQFGEDQFTFSKQVRDTRGGDDPLMPPNGRGLFAPAGANTATADFARAQSTGDPYVMAAVMQGNLEGLLPTWLGQSYDPGKTELYFSAAGVVACELRGDCESAYLNAGRCALSGDCEYQDYRQYVASSFSGKDREEYDAALSKMRQAAGVPPPRP